MPASISVVVPVYNGAGLLDRAIRSVRQQTFADWELLAVDDGSSDGSRALLEAWAEEDRRIHAIHLAENSGLSAARNAALWAASAPTVTYLDHDDEFFPDYLEAVMRHRDKGDVLVFGYDIVYEAAGDAAAERVESWDPRRARGNLFAVNPVVPLGVAHRRDLLERVGGFNELLWREEDWEFWKRLARSGAEFAFLPLKSGRYHVRPQSLSRVPRLTARQRAAVVANWEAGRPIFENGNGRPGERSCRSQPDPLAVNAAIRCATVPGEGNRTHDAPRDGFHHAERDEYKRKIVYLAPHCLIDPTSGAAVATARGLRFLQTLGFQCRAFCGSRLDLPEDVERMLARQQIACRRSTIAAGNSQLPVLVASLGGFAARGSVDGLEVTIFPNEAEQATDFYRACGAFLDADRPDAVVTYGGGALAETLIRLAKNRDLPLVFWLHNFAYYNPQAFALADYVIVPSQFNRRHYWESIGLACQVLPLVVDGGRVGVEGRPHPDPFSEGEATLARQYVTLVNPQRTKGLYVFARIAAILAAQRPDIPLLVMAGRSQAGWQTETGIDLSALPNVTVRPSVRDPRAFYAATKLLLMPSLWNESFGLVAAEAMLNGIPVLASNRGALPETIGNAGFLLEIPARYTPETRDLPTAEEVEPWVETIIRLWDDATEYGRWSRAARERARLWHPDRLAAVYREFFGRLTHQPGPPLVPKTAGT